MYFHGNQEGQREEESGEGSSSRPRELLLPKPMSYREMNFVADNQLFLLRNIERVKRIRESILKKRVTSSNHRTNSAERQYTKDRSGKGESLQPFC